MPPHYATPPQPITRRVRLETSDSRLSALLATLTALLYLRTATFPSSAYLLDPTLPLLATPFFTPAPTPSTVTVQSVSILAPSLSSCSSFLTSKFGAAAPS